MRLNIGNFPVHKILFGQETKWESLPEVPAVLREGAD